MEEDSLIVPDHGADEEIMAASFASLPAALAGRQEKGPIEPVRVKLPAYAKFSKINPEEPLPSAFTKITAVAIKPFLENLASSLVSREGAEIQTLKIPASEGAISDRLQVQSPRIVVAPETVERSPIPVPPQTIGRQPASPVASENEEIRTISRERNIDQERESLPMLTQSSGAAPNPERNTAMIAGSSAPSMGRTEIVFPIVDHIEKPFAPAMNAGLLVGDSDVSKGLPDRTDTVSGVVREGAIEVGGVSRIHVERLTKLFSEYSRQNARTDATHPAVETSAAVSDALPRSSSPRTSKPELGLRSAASAAAPISILPESRRTDRAVNSLATANVVSAMKGIEQAVAATAAGSISKERVAPIAATAAGSISKERVAPVAATPVSMDRLDVSNKQSMKSIAERISSAAGTSYQFAAGTSYQIEGRQSMGTSEHNRQSKIVDPARLDNRVALAETAATDGIFRQTGAPADGNREHQTGERIRGVDAGSRQHALPGLETILAGSLIALAGAAKKNPGRQDVPALTEEQFLALEPGDEIGSEPLVTERVREAVLPNSPSDPVVAVLRRPYYLVQSGDTLTSIALRFFNDAKLGWLIADINSADCIQQDFENKRIVELKARQQIELPVWQDIIEFRNARNTVRNIENLITVVTENTWDRDLVNTTLGSLFGQSSGSFKSETGDSSSGAELGAAGGAQSGYVEMIRRTLQEMSRVFAVKPASKLHRQTT